MKHLKFVDPSIDYFFIRTRVGKVAKTLRFLNVRTIHIHYHVNVENFCKEFHLVFPQFKLKDFRLPKKRGFFENPSFPFTVEKTTGKEIYLRLK